MVKKGSWAGNLTALVIWKGDFLSSSVLLDSGFVWEHELPRDLSSYWVAHSRREVNSPWDAGGRCYLDRDPGLQRDSALKLQGGKAQFGSHVLRKAALEDGTGYLPGGQET